MEERHDVETAIFLGQLQRERDVACGRAEIAVGQRHDFRAGGRPGGVQHERDVLGVWQPHGAATVVIACVAELGLEHRQPELLCKLARGGVDVWAR